MGNLHRLHQRREVGQISGNDLDIGKLIAQKIGLGIVLTLDHAEHLISLAMQELGEMLAILAGDSCDERAGHGFSSNSARVGP